MGSISKSFLILAVLAAVVLLLSSKVAARALAETTTQKKKGEVATEDYYYGNPYSYAPITNSFCPSGCCRYDFQNRCEACCQSPYDGETVDAETHADPPH
ncbi:hypothetical protein V6N13_088319 [Hibiscus sabdariffa]|uniref:Uncharacterized protein n=2 Tax=Hibiscus sabdariffa TaxID=183260 RepID=A0ABR1Z5Z7_9ROSI